ncbi:glycosyl transferase [Pigmentiphaga litoralis]|uniref:glycosyltransferase family 2 protein n=1 Tax=Pigmentiphaga litoralis TaxID=516702 RepID=UPI0016788C29|nr:glycosyltransferase family 2 protein [Pigmentiphaga litoralis]GGX16438.1 glycosyl transferase [Pigmentiphaga litoralis]
MIKVAVVTVLFNSNDVLPGFFSSLHSQRNIDLSVFVIDNSATREGCEISTKLGAEYGIAVTTVFNDANLGVAKGNNQGIEMALAANVDYVVLSNNDVEFGDPNMIAGMIDAMTREGVSASVPKMLYFGTRTIWCAGGHISKLKAISPHLGDMEEDAGQHNTAGVTEYAPTCFMILKPEVFHDIGLMDEQYFVYYDDTDFVWRMRQRGHSILYVPTYELFHKVSFSTGGNDSLFSLYYATRNRLFFARKNLPAFLKLVAISYTTAAMAAKSLRFTPDRRRKVFQALIDGISTKLV